MKDRLLRLSFAGALVVHLGVIAAGGALSPYLGRSDDSEPMRTIDVGLETPEPPPAPEPAKPAPPVAPSPVHPVSPSPPPPVSPSPRLPVSEDPAPTRVAAADPLPPSEEQPGGALNLGTPSERGDIEGLPSGKTPVGWVPGADEGKGAGSGAGEGVGRPEPPPRPEPQPQPVPAPAPTPQPAPKPAPLPPPRRVSVRVCAATRLRPNPHCPECVTIEVAEGSEPQGVCGVHKPPPPPPQPKPDPKPAPEPAPVAQPKPEPALTPARLVRTVKPRYPESALLGDHEGSVSLKVDVHADGTCGEIEITRSSGSRVLDAAAVKAVKRWRWEPAKRGAEPVASTARCRVRFELEE